jgi:hypothetical protein
MIVTSGGRVCLVDFLDSFCDSWMIDAAKVLQDMELYWSFRNKPVSPDSARRIKMARDMIFDKLSAMENGSEKLRAVYHLLLLNVIRIWPYAEIQKSGEWLKTATQKAIELVRGLD